MVVETDTLRIPSSAWLLSYASHHNKQPKVYDVSNLLNNKDQHRPTTNDSKSSLMFARQVELDCFRSFVRSSTSVMLGGRTVVVEVRSTSEGMI